MTRQDPRSPAPAPAPPKDFHLCPLGRTLPAVPALQFPPAPPSPEAPAALSALGSQRRSSETMWDQLPSAWAPPSCTASLWPCSPCPRSPRPHHPHFPPGSLLCPWPLATWLFHMLSPLPPHTRVPYISCHVSVPLQCIPHPQTTARSFVSPGGSAPERPKTWKRGIPSSPLVTV